MGSLRYPPHRLIPDYLRAGAGIVLAVLLPLAAGGGTAIVASFAAIGLLALGFGLRTMARQATRVSVTHDAIETTGWRARRLAWDEITRARLRYLPAGLRRESGWLALNLGAEGIRLRLDSDLEGFAGLVERAMAAAKANGVALDRPSELNLARLGLLPPS